MTLVKVCGVTREADLAACVDAGADLVGLIVGVARSPRSLTPARAAELARLSLLPVVTLVASPAPESARDIAEACAAAAVQLVTAESEASVAAVARALAGARTGSGPVRLMAALPLPAADFTEDVGEDAAGAWAAGWADAARRGEALARAGAQELVLDTAVVEPSGVLSAGGTGRRIDWARAAGLVGAFAVPAWLAGGLTRENVADAVRAVRPHGVDVSGGVESAPGVKDPALIAAFVSAVRDAGA